MNNKLNKDLYNSVMNKEIDKLKTLLSSGANINLVDNIGRTPLFIASQNRHIDIVKIFYHQVLI